MENRCEAYDESVISQYVDNELSVGKSREISQHLKSCPVCSRLADSYQQLSVSFVQNTARQVDAIASDAMASNVLAQIKQNETGFLKKIIDYFSPKLYLKIASIAVIMVIGLVYIQTKPINGLGPSAIVNSVDGNVSSVMIIETQNKKHTIIWFSET